MSNINLNLAKELRITSIKKYWRHTGQFEMELDWLYDWILALAIFVRHLHDVYNNEKVTENMNIK